MRNRLEAALSATGYAFAHYGWSHAPAGDYGVFGEDRGDDFVAGDRHVEHGTSCFVTLYTRDDGPLPRRKVEEALNTLRCPWRLNAVLYERDSGYIHFEWIVRILGELWEPDPEAGGDDDAESQN